MHRVNTHELISAIYAATLSPGDFHRTFDNIDELLFRGEGEQNGEAVPAGQADAPVVDAEMLRHVEMAVSIQRRISRARTDEQRSASILEAVPNPCYLVTRAESVLAANGLAVASYGAAPATLSGVVTDPDVYRQVKDFLRRADPQGLLAVAGPARKGRSTQTSVLVRRVDEALLGGTGGSAFLISIVDFGFDAATVELFRTTYGMTQAEARVAVLLASGLSLADIARERGVSLDTVRTQIKLIKHKTAARDIAALVRLLCGFTASALAQAPARPVRQQRSAGGGPVHERRTLVLGDGRRVEYVEQGAADGAPVLLFHNVPYGAHLPQAAIRYAHNARLRIVAPFRPGFGGSDPVEADGPEVLLDRVADDAAELMRMLGMRRAVVLNHGLGAPFALRFAGRHPDLVTRLITVGRAPIWRDEWLSQTPQRQRLMLRLTRYTPQLLPVVAWAMLACMDSAYANEFVIYNCKDGEADHRAVRESQEIIDLIAKGSVEALRNGLDSMCRELPLALRDMSAEARACPHKFLVLHGGDDRIVPAGQIAAFLEQVPGTALETVPGAGQLLFLSHWRPMLEAVKRSLPAPGVAAMQSRPVK